MRQVNKIGFIILVERLIVALLSVCLFGPANAQEAPGKYGEWVFGKSLFEAGHPTLENSCMSTIDRDRIDRALHSYLSRQNSTRQSLPPYSFFPQAGELYKDLWATNFVDLLSGSGIEDWDCTEITYDGHDAIDAAIRSFEYQDLGFPVFAAAAGVVVDAHDGEFDKNTSWQGQPSNYVVIDHGSGRICHYLHLQRNSVAVQAGDPVKAGQQIGSTGSSGNSLGPHLHFSSYDQGQVYEPFVGPCHSGSSGWANQVPVNRDLTLWDCAVAFEDPMANGGPPWPLPRSGHIELTDPFTYFWASILNLSAQSHWQIQFVAPDGSLVYDSGSVSFGNSTDLLGAWWYWAFDFPELHQQEGTWHLLLFVNNVQLIQAPFEVVVQRNPSQNRPPHAVGIEILPQSPNTQDVISCRVNAPLVLSDPDYEITRFRYQWTVNGVTVRDIQSAAHRDYLPQEIAGVGQTVQCTVTPSDGTLDGPTEFASVLVGSSDLRLHAPKPGVAGQLNHIDVETAGSSGRTVHLAYGLRVGVEPLAACSGLELDLHRPNHLQRVVTNGQGRGTAQVWVPWYAQGQEVYLQAVSISDCAKSNLLGVTFR